MELPTIAESARNLVADGLADPGPDAMRAAIVLLAAAEQVNEAAAGLDAASAALCPQPA